MSDENCNQRTGTQMPVIHCGACGTEFATGELLLAHLKSCPQAVIGKNIIKREIKRFHKKHKIKSCAGAVHTSRLNLRLPAAEVERWCTCAEMIGVKGVSAFVRRACRMECDRIAATRPKAPFFIDPKDLAQNPMIVTEEDET